MPSLQSKYVNSSIADADSQPQVFIAGRGAVGTALLRLIQDINHVNLIGSANSQTIFWQDKPQEKQNWDTLKQLLIRRIAKAPVLFVDVSGAVQIAQDYDSLLRAGIHVVTASKVAESRSMRYYDLINELADNKQNFFKKEASVLAGLPVLSTISSLIKTNDQVHKIEGVFSGTLTYIFSELQKGQTWSSIIPRAKELGYAETDPRDDLNGEDVARKCLILARAAGWNIEREDLMVDDLAGSDCRDITLATFLDELQDQDKRWSDRVQAAAAAGEVLRYVSTIQDGSVTCRVQSVSESSPLGQLSGTDNIIRIYTDRYQNTPITISGPGAGPEVTASGVLQNILEITDRLINY